MRNLALLVVATLALTGCNAVRQWDAMKIQEKQKHAVYALSEQCDNGNMEACAYLAGPGIRVQGTH